MADKNVISKLNDEELKEVSGGQTILEALQGKPEDQKDNPNVRQMRCWCGDVFWADISQDEVKCSNGHINTIKG